MKLNFLDNGFQWINQIPKKWKVQRLKTFSFIKSSNVDKKSIEGQKEVLLCNYNEVYQNEFITGNMDFMKATASENQIYSLSLKKGDIIITKDSETAEEIGVPAYVSDSLIGVVCGYHLAIIRPNRDIAINKFIYRALQTPNIAFQYSISANGITRFGLKISAIGEAIFPIPPILEQDIIIKYLDKITAEIDSLIDVKTRHITLLEEYRHSMILEAVTKGLDPTVPMQESGIERLGKYPKTWILRRLKTFANIKPSNVDKKSVEDQKEVLLCNYNEVYQNEFIISSMNFMKATATDKQIEHLTINEGDIIITKDSETALEIGIPAFVKDELDGIVCGYHLAVIKSNPKICFSKYLFRAIQSQFIAEQYSISANGITRYGLKVSAIGNAIFPLPPTIEEQKEIAQYIDEKCATISELTLQITSQIEKFKEYRQALISEAVTGKISVKIMEEELNAKN